MNAEALRRPARFQSRVPSPVFAYPWRDGLRDDAEGDGRGLSPLTRTQGIAVRLDPGTGGVALGGPGRSTTTTRLPSGGVGRAGAFLDGTGSASITAGTRSTRRPSAPVHPRHPHPTGWADPKTAVRRPSPEGADGLPMSPAGELVPLIGLYQSAWRTGHPELTTVGECRRSSTPPGSRPVRSPRNMVSRGRRCRPTRSNCGSGPFAGGRVGRAGQRGGPRSSTNAPRDSSPPGVGSSLVIDYPMTLVPGRLATRPRSDRACLSPLKKPPPDKCGAVAMPRSSDPILRGAARMAFRGRRPCSPIPRKTPWSAVSGSAGSTSSRRQGARGPATGRRLLCAVDAWTTRDVRTWRRIGSCLSIRSGLKVIAGRSMSGARHVAILRDLNGDGEGRFVECFNTATRYGPFPRVRDGTSGRPVGESLLLPRGPRQPETAFVPQATGRSSW